MINWTGKRVLVCGGAGMIGSHLSQRLVEMGAQVTVADNLSSGSKRNIEHIKKSVKFKEYDLRSEELAMTVAYGQDAVFQLAADMGGIGYITRVGADIMYNSGLINMNMLKAAVRNDVPLYFYSSSA